MEFLTPRLVVREFCDGDFERFRALEARPETYFYERASPDAAATRVYLAQAQADAALGLGTEAYPRRRYRLAVLLRATGMLIGRVTLTVQNAAIGEWEVGWAIHPDFWRQGYAVEAARPLLALAFDTLGAHRVIAFAHAENYASRRVMEKLGMRQEGLLRETFRWRGGWADEVVYGLLEREWGGVF